MRAGGGTDNVLGTNGDTLPRWLGPPARKQPSASFPPQGRRGRVGSRSSIARVSCTAPVRGNRLEQYAHTQTKVGGRRFPGDQGVMSCTLSGSWWLLPTAGLGHETGHLRCRGPGKAYLEGWALWGCRRREAGCPAQCPALEPQGPCRQGFCSHNHPEKTTALHKVLFTRWQLEGSCICPPGQPKPQGIAQNQGSVPTMLLESLSHPVPSRSEGSSCGCSVVTLW